MRINILSHPRSGSTYLYDIMTKAMPDHFGYFEPNRIFKNDPEIEQNYNTSTFRKDYPVNWNNNNIITKNHLHHQQPPGNWYTIKIIRKDIFQSALSLSLGLISKNFVFIDDNVYHILPDKFIENLKFIYLQAKNLNNHKSDLLVYYEDLTFDPITDLNNLGFHTTHNITPISKMVDKKKTVQNYNELREIYEKINLPSIHWQKN